MKQELFDGIAMGDLPILAMTLLGGRVPGDHQPCPDTTRLPQAAGMDQALVQAQWIALLAHLSQTARRCAQADVAGQLKAMGVRRTQTVVASLAREYVHTWDLAGTLGIALPASAIMRLADGMPLHGRLAKHFRELAQAYMTLLWITAPREGSQLFRWLSERAAVHTAQAQAIL